MFQSIFGAWEWVRDQALTKLLILVSLIAVSFVSLKYYPVTVEFKSTRTENYVQYDSINCYVVSTTWAKEGAKLFVESHTTVSEVKQEESK